MSKATQLIQIMEVTTPGYAFLKNVQYFTKAIEPALPNGRYHVSVSTQNRNVIINLHFEKPVNLGEGLENRVRKFIVKMGTGIFRTHLINVDFSKLRGTLVNGIDVSFHAMKEISNVEKEFKSMNTRSKLGSHQAPPAHYSGGSGMRMSMRTLPSAKRYDDED